MIQIEIIENSNEEQLINDANYFLEQLEEHLFIDIRYSSFFVKEDGITNIRYSVLIIYRVL